MREKDLVRLANKLKFVKTMHNFWPWCGSCNAHKHSGWDSDCIHKRARIGYIIEINRGDNTPRICWRKEKPGICKYYENKEKK